MASLTTPYPATPARTRNPFETPSKVNFPEFGDLAASLASAAKKHYPSSSPLCSSPSPFSPAPLRSPSQCEFRPADWASLLQADEDGEDEDDDCFDNDDNRQSGNNKSAMFRPMLSFANCSETPVKRAAKSAAATPLRTPARSACATERHGLGLGLASARRGTGLRSVCEGEGEGDMLDEEEESKEKFEKSRMISDSYWSSIQAVDSSPSPAVFQVRGREER